MRYVVAMKKDVSKADFLSYLTSVGATVQVDYDALERHFVIDCDPDVGVAMETHDMVASVQSATAEISLSSVINHGIMENGVSISSEPSVASTQTLNINSDGWYDNWGLARIGYRDVRDIPADFKTDGSSYPRSGSYSYVRDGSNVDIYIVDTGLGDGLSDITGRYTMLYDHFVTEGDPAYGIDTQGHGSHVATIAAGTQWGVAKNAHIQVVRVFQGDTTTSEAIAGGVNAALGHHLQKIANGDNRPSVMNMSLSGPPDPLDQAIYDCIDAGIVVVAAAGNDGTDLATIGYDRNPAEITQAITVGALELPQYTSEDSYDQIWLYSNYGSVVDVFAPGAGINAAHFEDGYTARKSGTSMAAPHVAGVVALRLQRYPIGQDASYVAEVHDWVVNNASVDTIIETEAKLSTSANRVLFSEYVANRIKTAGVNLSGFKI